MKRLIADAAELSDTVDAQDMSFANIVKAINVVQTEMGITGTTAKEAASTIQGSVGMMKSSWTNLVTGIADENANLDVLITNFVDSVGTVAQNIVPKIGVALNSASTLISNLIPVIVQEIPVLIEENLPILAEAAISIIQSLVDGISENQKMLMTTAFETITFLATSLISMFPQIVALGLDLIVSLANGIAESLPELIPAVIEVMMQIVDTLTQPETLSNLLDASLAVILALADGLVQFIPELIDATITIIDKLITFLLEPENIVKLAEAAVKIVVALAEGLVKSVGTLMEATGELISNVVEKFKETDWAQVGKDVVNGIWEGLKGMWNSLSEWFSNAWDGLVGGVKDLLGIHSPSRVFADIGKNMALGVGSGWEDKFGDIKKDIDKSLIFDDAKIGISASTKSVPGLFGGRSNYGGVSVIQNIYSEAKTAADLMQEALYQQERAVLLGV